MAPGQRRRDHDAQDRIVGDGGEQRAHQRRLLGRRQRIDENVQRQQCQPKPCLLYTSLQKVKPKDLTENSVLLGSPARIIDTLKKVEAAGFAEVILYFNVGLKPHQQVKDEMARFMGEVAPAFAGVREEHAA